MALVKDPSVPTLSLLYAGKRNDTGTISLYQGPDVVGGSTWSSLSNDVAIVSLATSFNAVIDPITDAVFCGATYAGQSWTDNAYFPGYLGEMRDVGVFTFETSKRKKVSITIPAFVKTALVQTQVSPSLISTAAAVSLEFQDALIDMHNTSVEAFVQACISGVTWTDPDHSEVFITYRPHSPSAFNGDIIACIKGVFVQRGSPIRSSRMA